MPAEFPTGPSDRPLEGRTALVTGSAKGLGRAIAERLARQGAAVAIHYLRSEAPAAEAVEAIRAAGGRAEAFQADVTVPGQAQDLVAAVQQRLGSLDVLVNNVGDYVKRDVLELDLAEWHHMFDSNLHAAYYTCRAAAPAMAEARFGRIVNLGFAGVEHVVGKTQITPYYISKQGLLVLTRALAKRLAADGVTANMVSPGILETSVTGTLFDVPMKRLGRLTEFVEAIAYLMGPQAEYITGQNLEIAGGWGL